MALPDHGALEQCVAFLRELPTLCATLIVPEAGVSVASTPGWASALPQDLEGELVSRLQVRDGLEAPSELDDDDDRIAEELPALLPERPAAIG